MKYNLKFLIVLFLFLMSHKDFAFAGGGHDHGHDHGHGHEEEHSEEPAKGPHGGKLLKKDDFALEVTIYEDDVPPQYRIYAYEDEEPLKPSDVKVTISLKRFGREEEHFSFEQENDYLTSKKIIEEPHSFDVSIKAEYDKKDYDWSYQSHEGRTELSASALKVADLGFDTAGPQVISNNIRVYGRLIANENKVAHLVPRFPGIIKEVRKQLGDKVEKGETLAIVESNQNLQPYEVRSFVSGIVISRHATAGEFVNGEKEIFIVADLSELWADFQVYRDDFGIIEAGQKINVDLGEGKEVSAMITYTSPVVDETTQSKLIRAVLPNTSSELRPGLFVSGILSSPQGTAPLAVNREAVQTFRDWNVVYITDGHSFQAMPVELGRKDSKFYEILSGLKAGDKYVSKNSFIIKADIEKAGASHDH